jgi:ATP adenylyltransferase
MTEPIACFPDDSLPARIRSRSGRALATGALVPIATTERRIDDGGVRFVVRAVSSLARKRWDSLSPPVRSNPANPFLPYDPDLFVGDLGASHVCLLNKFPVIDGHVLIVTSAFEHQDRLLGRQDFDALFRCLKPIDGLGFYNGGTVAGASQPHKHMQVVPLPLSTDDGPPVPIAARLNADSSAVEGIARVDLPFRHRVARLDRRRMTHADAAGSVVHDLYQRMLDALGIGPVERHGGPCAASAYNLLITLDWMLLVPRSRENVATVSVNALGFAGSLFVRDDKEMDLIAATGPMTLLRDVGFA